ncbi:MAG TPA: magnesium transporter [Phycisphaerae bacterium]|nr:magnesium transporter [Phycisphaerae bacterium]
MKTALPLDRPVTEFLTNSAVTLRESQSVDETLAELRANAVGGGAMQVQSAAGQVIYFYVVNEQEQLVGVLPSRKLILSPGGARVGDLMLRDVISLRPSDTLFDALELFAMHRLLAIPVVDAEKKLLGVVEISLYTDEVFDLAHNQQLNEVFQLMGLHLEEHKQGAGGAWRGFRLRMPWLLSNIGGGLACAALGSFFEATVQKVVVLALFIPLVLTLAESVSVQSMTLAIEQAASRKGNPGALLREFLTAVMLGVCSGVVVGCVSLLWNGPRAASLTIAGAVVVTMVLAAVLGRVLPKVVYRLRLNPRIASGPITLAVVDICTVFLYLLGATIVLGT